MTDETTPTPTFDPTWLRGDMFALPKDVNDAKDEGEPQRDDVVARLTAERDRARATAVQLEQELARVKAELAAARAKWLQDDDAVAVTVVQGVVMADDSAPTSIAGYVECPECGDVIPIGLAPLQLVPHGSAGTSSLTSWPWSQAWLRRWAR